MIKKLLFLILLSFYLPFFAQEDCNTAISVCGNSGINYTPIGTGNIYEFLPGCLSTEHHSVWYKFTVATSGTLTFDLIPTGPVDYDWAIYGPNVTCNNKGFPIRCNASGAIGNTGMNMTNTNTTSAGGPTNPYCKFMDVVAGQTYFLYVDNWSPTVFTFNLNWGGTATFVSPFNSNTIAPNPFVPPGNAGPNANSPREIPICGNTFDFSTLSAGIINGNNNFNITYFSTPNDAATGNNPITTPIAVNTTNTYYYNINYSDPTNPGSAINSCKKTAAIIFKNNVLISTINASSTTLCPNGSVTLTSNHTNGNTWSTGENSQTITVTAPGTYTLTTTNGLCTSQPVSVSINNGTNPNVQITGNLVLCETPSTQLTATANGQGNTFAWSNGANTATTTATAPGTYTVTVTTLQNCQYQKSVTVVQGTVPVVQNSVLNQCSNTATAVFNLTTAEPNISTTPGVTFDYYLDQADALAGNTNNIVNPANHTSGNATIFVRVKSSTCWKIAQLQLSVTQFTTPTITPSSNVICGNNAVTLTSNLATGNVWSTGETTQAITVTTPGTFSLTNQNGNCSSQPVSVDITQQADPNIQITGNLTFCEGSNTTLSATAAGLGNNFTWSNGVNGANNTVAAPGIYTVTVITASGCQFQKSVTVTTNPVPVINISPANSIDCNNPQVTLNAVGSVFQAGATITWTTIGGNIVNGANTLTPTVNTQGIYTLTITNPSGCESEDNINIVENTTLPVIALTATQINICQGDAVTLTAAGAATYTWTGLPGNGNTQVVSPTVTTTYTVTGTGANGCAAAQPSNITINVVPEIISTLQNTLVCKGNSVKLDAGEGPNYTYLWSTGENTQTIEVAQSGTYTVTIDNGICTKTFSATVSYTVTPQISEIIYKNNTLTINVQNPTNVNLEYSIDNGSTWQLYNTFANVIKNTLYPIRVRYEGTTCATSTEYYTLLISNVITPNSDGKNDIIDFSEISKYKNFEGIIFDRYNKIIFKASRKNAVWNGTYLNRTAATGNYWYQLSWEDSTSKKTINLTGWILLKNRE